MGVTRSRIVKSVSIAMPPQLGKAFYPVGHQPTCTIEKDFFAEIGRFENLRIFQAPSAWLQKLAIRGHTHLSIGEPLSRLRSEMIRYTWEQSISIDVHRYGHVDQVEMISTMGSG